MFYRLRRTLNTRRFDGAIAGILDTEPLVVRDAPWAIVSMVANRDVPMYLAAIKSFYTRIGRGKIVAIIDRAMPSPLRDTLSRHLPGIEFVILEDIPTAPCQRGGTWERLLYCLDRSAVEYTIQLDSDTLAVGDMSEVVECLRANRAFTMADGFFRVPLAIAAEQAQATPTNRYIGIVSEATFSRYPGAEKLHYIRGSSGFAGFAKGGFTRAAMAVFHQEMEKLVGESRWREWGSEQCGSNFAIANSPDPLVLPYPEYASFDHHVPRATAKFYHFIGRFRFAEGYFARRTQEVIAALTPGATPVAPPVERTPIPTGGGAFRLLRGLTAASRAAYLGWRVSGGSQPVTLELRQRKGWPKYPRVAPRFRLPGTGVARSGLDGADDVFARCLYASPVWIPEQRVTEIVDFGAGNGMSCVWWLALYWRARVVACEENPARAEEIQANVAANDYGPRLELRLPAKAAPSSLAGRNPAVSIDAAPSDLLALVEGRRVDILKIDLAGGEIALLSDQRFGTLDLGAVAVRWRRAEGSGAGGRDWCIDRLERLGFRVYAGVEDNERGVVWGYKS